MLLTLCGVIAYCEAVYPSRPGGHVEVHDGCKNKSKRRQKRWMGCLPQKVREAALADPEGDGCQCSNPYVQCHLLLWGRRAGQWSLLCLLETLQHSISACLVGTLETKRPCFCLQGGSSAAPAPEASWGRSDFLFFFLGLVGKIIGQSRPVRNGEGGANC